MRFAFGVTGCTLALTILASLIIALAEPPAGGEYLLAEDLQTIGLIPSAFRSQRLLLPQGVVSHQYTADVAERRVVVCAEVRLGESSGRLAEIYDQETAQAQKQPTASYSVIRERVGKGGAGEMVLVVRVLLFSRGGQITAEAWIQEGSTYLHARVIEMDVPEDRVPARRQWCQRHARTLAAIMHGHVRESVHSPSS